MLEDSTVTAPRIRLATGGTTRVGTWTLYGGWIMGSLIILAVLAIGATLWFHFHP